MTLANGQNVSGGGGLCWLTLGHALEVGAGQVGCKPRKASRPSPECKVPQTDAVGREAFYTNQKQLLLTHMWPRHRSSGLDSAPPKGVNSTFSPSRCQYCVVVAPSNVTWKRGQRQTQKCRNRHVAPLFISKATLSPNFHWPQTRFLA